LLSNAVNRSKKFELVKVATACTSSVINSFGVEVLEWLKKHNIKWLKDMACVRRQSEDMNKPLLTEFEDFSCQMAVISITQ
jgi:hypothetical protein